MWASSVTALLHDLADAEVHLEPRGARQNLQGEKGRDLHQVHGQERHRVIAAEDGVVARGHLRQAQLVAILRLPKASHQEELVHDPIAEGVWLGGHELRVAARFVLQVRVSGADALVPLEGANRAVDPRVAFNGHHVARGCVHQVQRQLSRQVHGLPQAPVKFKHVVVVFAALPPVHQARSRRLEKLEARERSLVEDGEAAVLWVFQDLLDHVWHLLARVARPEVLQLPMLVGDRQKEDLRACLRVVNRRLHDVALSVVRLRLLVPEEPHGILQALHVCGLWAGEPCLHENLVEGELVVEFVARLAIKGEDADMRGQAFPQVGVRRAFHRSCAWDDQINLLLSDYGLDGRLPLLGLYCGPRQHVVLGDIGAEARVAELVRHDFRRENLVPIPAHRTGDCRRLGHLAAGNKDPKLLFRRTASKRSTKHPVMGPSHKRPKQQERRASPQEGDGQHRPQPCGPWRWCLYLCRSCIRRARLLGS
mmetsp:Transcript_135835/g.264369  ORF Transcript_135835/g.264369 Transcript_135835/m.264369 type:complete len:480 (+) Transcript_135835:318-1757(+)